MDVEIKITDLDELIDNESKLVKVAGYTIDINKIPLKVFIEIKKMISNPSISTEDNILKNVIYPLVKYQGTDVAYDEFENSFTVKKVIKFWNAIIKELYGVDVEKTDDTAASSIQTYKKKE